MLAYIAAVISPDTTDTEKRLPKVLEMLKYKVILLCFLKSKKMEN